MKAFFFIIALLTYGSFAGETQIELNDRAAKEAKAADIELNKKYKQLMSLLEEESKKKLVDAQRAWIKFRDTECEFEEADYGDGSIRPLIHWNSLCRMTKARTKELEAKIDEFH